jgi:ParB family chromosome partitioning protein
MSQRVVQQIALDRIIRGKQVREHFDDESLSGLTQSMRENGLHEPIHVLSLDGERYSLLTGGRRVCAARKAGWTTIAAIVEKADLSKSDILVRQLIENVQREDLKPLEKAKAIDLLMKESGWNASQTATKLGLANGTVTKLLALLSLPEQIQEKIRAGELPATAAYELTHVNGAAEREELASRVANGELTRDELSGSIKSQKRKSTNRKAARRRKVQVTATLKDRQSVTVCAPNLDLGILIGILENLLGLARQAQSDQLVLTQFLKRLKVDRAKAASEPAAPMPAPEGAVSVNQEGIVTAA